MGNFHRKYWERDKLNKRRHPSHPVVKEYVIPRIEEIRKIVPIDKNTRLLDVGCGNGFFSYYFEKICNTIGIDSSKKMIAMNPIKQKYLMSADNLGFKDNSFDIVFCHMLLHHVTDVNKVINEIKRVSKKYIVVLEPNRNNPLMFLFCVLIREERKALKFSLSFLKNICMQFNLKIISAFSYGLLVPNKTMRFMLPIIKLFNFRQPFGITNFLIAQK